MGENVTLDMGKTGLQSRPSLGPWLGPSFCAQLWLGEARTVTSAMGPSIFIVRITVSPRPHKKEGHPPPGPGKNLGHTMALAHVDFPRRRIVGGQPRRGDPRIWLNPGSGEATGGRPLEQVRMEGKE
ncbi:unnamed protein product [Prunus armeniaca]